LEPRPPQLPNNFKLDEAELAELGELITAKPDMTLEELAAALSKKVSVSTVHRATKKLKLTLKKSPSTPRNRTGRM
jgi:transposase